MEQDLAVGFVSVVVELELMVGPLRAQDAAGVEQMQMLLNVMPNLVVRPVDRDVARHAARIRAATGLRAPDAIITASAILDRCDAIVGNDRTMARRVQGVRYLCLDDYVV